MQERAVFTVMLHSKKERVDIDVPLDISANDLVIALNESLSLGIDTDNIQNCVLSVESPIAMIRGNKTLREYGLRDGSIINIM